MDGAATAAPLRLLSLKENCAGGEGGEVGGWGCGVDKHKTLLDLQGPPQYNSQLLKTCLLSRVFDHCEQETDRQTCRQAERQTLSTSRWILTPFLLQAPGGALSHQEIFLFALLCFFFLAAAQACD